MENEEGPKEKEGGDMAKSIRGWGGAQRSGPPADLLPQFIVRKEAGGWSLASRGSSLAWTWNMVKKHSPKGNSTCLFYSVERSSARFRKGIDRWEISLFSFFLSFFFFFKVPYTWHIEGPRLGVKMELQQACLHCSSQQCQILNPWSKARNGTCILMDTSWVLNLLRHNGNSVSFFFFKVKA